jgi:hypothetical protein
VGFPFPFFLLSFAGFFFCGVNAYAVCYRDATHFLSLCRFPFLFIMRPTTNRNTTTEVNDAARYGAHF